MHNGNAAADRREDDQILGFQAFSGVECGNEVRDGDFIQMALIAWRNSNLN